jgi:hypothetical protein
MDQQPGSNRFTPSSSTLAILKTPKLIWALFTDGRISFRYKLLPLAAFLWILLPDFVPGILDDLILSYLGPKFFLELCRDRHPRVYEEHYDRIFPEEARRQKQKAKEDRL